MTKKGAGQETVLQHGWEARPRHGASARHCAHDTAMEACDTHGKARRGVRHSARGTTSKGVRVSAATRQLGAYNTGAWPATRSGSQVTIRPCVHAWVCLCCNIPKYTLTVL